LERATQNWLDHVEARVLLQDAYDWVQLALTCKHAATNLPGHRRLNGYLRRARYCLETCLALADRVFACVPVLYATPTTPVLTGAIRDFFTQAFDDEESPLRFTMDQLFRCLIDRRRDDERNGNLIDSPRGVLINVSEWQRLLSRCAPPPSDGEGALLEIVGAAEPFPTPFARAMWRLVHGMIHRGHSPMGYVDISEAPWLWAALVNSLNPSLCAAILSRVVSAEDGAKLLVEFYEPCKRCYRPMVDMDVHMNGPQVCKAVVCPLFKEWQSNPSPDHLPSHPCHLAGFARWTVFIPSAPELASLLS